MLVYGINKVLNWCGIISNGKKYTCITKISEGELFFYFKKKWHKVADYISDNVDELVKERGKIISRTYNKIK